MPRTYTISEAGRQLGIGYRWTRMLVDGGKLKATNIAPQGRKPRWVVTPQAVAAYRRRRGR